MRIRFCNGDFIELEDTAKLEKLDEYAKLLVQWNGLSLIAKSTESDVYGWHILDALSILPIIEEILEFEPCNIVDFGAGGGVLGVSLARMGVENITLVERCTSKVSFLQDVLKFPSVDFDCRKVSQQLRDVSHINSVEQSDNKLELTSAESSNSFSKKKPIILIARGVSTITNILNAANVDIKYAILLKAYDIEAEIKEAKRYWSFDYKLYKRRAKAYGRVIFMFDIEPKNFAKKA